MFGSASSSASKQTVSSQLRITTSVQGKARAIGWGQSRVPGNLLWYGDFESHSSGSGGGGGKGGNSGKGGGGNVTYSCSFLMGLCEGPIAAVTGAWNNSSAVTLSSLDITALAGDYGQSPWSYLSAAHGDVALPYRGLAMVGAANMSLGNNATLPNLTFEVVFAINTAIAGVPDADPAAVVSDALTNPHYSMGFPAAYLGDLSVYSNYAIANGLLVSPLISDAQESRQFITDLLDATNSAAVWSGGVLKIVPYGDQTITANGRTYTAPSAPLYSLFDIDFKANQASNAHSSGSGSDPIQITRLRPADQKNSIQVEYLDRGNAYNPAVVEATDDAGINIYGLRRTSKTLHCFCLQSAALMSAQLSLGREAVRNTYAFTLGAEYILLDPMDIVAINDPIMVLSAHWVRITEITENSDATLSILAEDCLAGAGSAPLYQAQQALGVGPALNATPGSVITPVIWEPTYALAGATEIWLAVGAPANFGGAEIWVSNDNNTFRLAGTFEGNARAGLLTSGLVAVPQASPGIATIDQTNTVHVDMSGTGAQLLSGTQADAQAGNTVCYVGGEYLAYATATLTSGSTYALSYLARGLYDSAPVAAAAGTPLVRLSPGSYFQFPLTVDRIGDTFYFKILPYNSFGAGKPLLSSVASIPYTVTGVALAETLAAPSGLTTSYVGAFTYLSWREIQDWRAPAYEIRKGASWQAGLRLATVAHPPFMISGDDIYWVAAVVTPTQGLTVYSAPVSLTISSSTLAPNVAGSWDELATGWSGTVSGGAVVSGTLVTTSGGPTSQVGGIYEIPTSHQIDVGRVVACNVLINWTASGFPAASNVLTITDFLAVTDLLGGASTAAVSVYPEIAISQDGTTWGAWQRYTPGAYTGRKFKARMQIQTTDPGTEAVLSAFLFAVAPPERDDHYIGLAVPSAGMTVAFKPDGVTAASPFNGGPGNTALPAVHATILGASAGDTLVITSLTTSGCTIQVLNGSSGVARSINLLVQGY